MDFASEEMSYSARTLDGSKSKSLLKFGSLAALRRMSLTIFVSPSLISNQDPAMYGILICSFLPTLYHKNIIIVKI